MSDLALLDLLFLLIPEEPINCTYSVFCTVWNKYGLAGLQLSHIDPIENTLRTQCKPHQHDISYTHQYVDNYHQYMQNLYTFAINSYLSIQEIENDNFSQNDEKGLKSKNNKYNSFSERHFQQGSILCQKIWVIYTLYTLYCTQQPPLYHEYELIKLPYPIWSSFQHLIPILKNLKTITPHNIHSTTANHQKSTNPDPINCLEYLFQIKAINFSSTNIINTYPLILPESTIARDDLVRVSANHSRCVENDFFKNFQKYGKNNDNFQYAQNEKKMSYNDIRTTTQHTTQSLNNNMANMGPDGNIGPNYGQNNLNFDSNSEPNNNFQNETNFFTKLSNYFGFCSNKITTSTRNSQHTHHYNNPYSYSHDDISYLSKINQQLYLFLVVVFFDQFFSTQILLKNNDKKNIRLKNVDPFLGNEFDSLQNLHKKDSSFVDTAAVILSSYPPELFHALNNTLDEIAKQDSQNNQKNNQEKFQNKNFNHLTNSNSKKVRDLFQIAQKDLQKMTKFSQQRSKDRAKRRFEKVMAAGNSTQMKIPSSKAVFGVIKKHRKDLIKNDDKNNPKNVNKDSNNPQINPTSLQPLNKFSIPLFINYIHNNRSFPRDNNQTKEQNNSPQNIPKNDINSPQLDLSNGQNHAIKSNDEIRYEICEIIDVFSCTNSNQFENEFFDKKITNSENNLTFNHHKPLLSHSNFTDFDNYSDYSTMFASLNVIPRKYSLFDRKIDEKNEEKCDKSNKKEPSVNRNIIPIHGSLLLPGDTNDDIYTNNGGEGSNNDGYNGFDPNYSKTHSPLDTKRIKLRRRNKSTNLTSFYKSPTTITDFVNKNEFCYNLVDFELEKKTQKGLKAQLLNDFLVQNVVLTSIDGLPDDNQSDLQNRNNSMLISLESLYYSNIYTNNALLYPYPTITTDYRLAIKSNHQNETSIDDIKEEDNNNNQNNNQDNLNFPLIPFTTNFSHFKNDQNEQNFTTFFPPETPPGFYPSPTNPNYIKLPTFYDILINPVLEITSSRPSNFELSQFFSSLHTNSVQNSLELYTSDEFIMFRHGLIQPMHLSVPPIHRLTAFTNFDKQYYFELFGDENDGEILEQNNFQNSSFFSPKNSSPSPPRPPKLRRYFKPIPLVQFPYTNPTSISVHLSGQISSFLYPHLLSSQSSIGKNFKYPLRRAKDDQNKYNKSKVRANDNDFDEFEEEYDEGVEENDNEMFFAQNNKKRNEKFNFSQYSEYPIPAPHSPNSPSVSEKKSIYSVESDLVVHSLRTQPYSLLNIGFPNQKTHISPLNRTSINTGHRNQLIYFFDSLLFPLNGDGETIIPQSYDPQWLLMVKKQQIFASQQQLIKFQNLVNSKPFKKSINTQLDTLPTYIKQINTMGSNQTDNKNSINGQIISPSPPPPIPPPDNLRSIPKLIIPMNPMLLPIHFTVDLNPSQNGSIAHVRQYPNMTFLTSNRLLCSIEIDTISRRLGLQADGTAGVMRDIEGDYGIALVRLFFHFLIQSHRGKCYLYNHDKWNMYITRTHAGKPFWEVVEEEALDEKKKKNEIGNENILPNKNKKLWKNKKILNTIKINFPTRSNTQSQNDQNIDTSLHFKKSDENVHKRMRLNPTYKHTFGGQHQSQLNQLVRNSALGSPNSGVNGGINDSFNTSAKASSNNSMNDGENGGVDDGCCHFTSANNVISHLYTLFNLSTLPSVQNWTINMDNSEKRQESSNESSNLAPKQWNQTSQPLSLQPPYQSPIDRLVADPLVTFQALFPGLQWMFFLSLDQNQRDKWIAECQGYINEYNTYILSANAILLHYRNVYLGENNQVGNNSTNSAQIDDNINESRAQNGFKTGFDNITANLNQVNHTNDHFLNEKDDHFPKNDVNKTNSEDVRSGIRSRSSAKSHKNMMTSIIGSSSKLHPQISQNIEPQKEYQNPYLFSDKPLNYPDIDPMMQCHVWEVIGMPNISTQEYNFYSDFLTISKNSQNYQNLLSYFLSILSPNSPQTQISKSFNSLFHHFKFHHFSTAIETYITSYISMSGSSSTPNSNPNTINTHGSVNTGTVLTSAMTNTSITDHNSSLDVLKNHTKLHYQYKNNPRTASDLENMLKEIQSDVLWIHEALNRVNGFISKKKKANISFQNRHHNSNSSHSSYNELDDFGYSPITQDRIQLVHLYGIFFELKLKFKLLKKRYKLLLSTTLTNPIGAFQIIQQYQHLTHVNIIRKYHNKHKLLFLKQEKAKKKSAIDHHVRHHFGQNSPHFGTQNLNGIDNHSHWPSQPLAELPLHGDGKRHILPILSLVKPVLTTEVSEQEENEGGLKGEAKSDAKIDAKITKTAMAENIDQKMPIKSQKSSQQGKMVAATPKIALLSSRSQKTPQKIAKVSRKAATAQKILKIAQIRKTAKTASERSITSRKAVNQGDTDTAYVDEDEDEDDDEFVPTDDYQSDEDNDDEDEDEDDSDDSNDENGSKEASKDQNSPTTNEDTDSTTPSNDDANGRGSSGSDDDDDDDDDDDSNYYDSDYSSDYFTDITDDSYSDLSSDDDDDEEEEEDENTKGRKKVVMRNKITKGPRKLFSNHKPEKNGKNSPNDKNIDKIKINNSSFQSVTRSQQSSQHSNQSSQLSRPSSQQRYSLRDGHVEAIFGKLNNIPNQKSQNNSQPSHQHNSQQHSHQNNRSQQPNLIFDPPSQRSQSRLSRLDESQSSKDIDGTTQPITLLKSILKKGHGNEQAVAQNVEKRRQNYEFGSKSENTFGRKLSTPAMMDLDDNDDDEEEEEEEDYYDDEDDTDDDYNDDDDDDDQDDDQDDDDDWVDEDDGDGDYEEKDDSEQDEE